MTYLDGFLREPFRDRRDVCLDLRSLFQLVRLHQLHLQQATQSVLHVGCAGLTQCQSGKRRL